MPKIKNMGSSTTKFNEGIIVSGSAANNETLIVTGSAIIAGTLHISGSDQEGLRVAKGNNDYRQIVFENDGVDAASFTLSNAENLVIMNESGTNHDKYLSDGSGYNLFSREERSRLIAEIKEIGENANFNGFKVTSNEPLVYSNNYATDGDGKTIFKNDHLLDAQRMATYEFHFTNESEPAFVFHFFWQFT